LDGCDYMPRGYPDWTSPIDIVYQTISEVITKPAYGCARRIFGAQDIPAWNRPFLFTISGCGIIYGGFIEEKASTDQSVDELFIHIDGQVLFNSTWDGLEDRNLNTCWDAFFYIKKFYETAGSYHYVAGCSHGITFDTSFAIQVYNNTVNDTWVRWDIMYALI